MGRSNASCEITAPCVNMGSSAEITKESNSAVPNNVEHMESDVVIENEVKLKRELGLPSAIGLQLGNIIGSGIFVAPKGAARGGGSVAATLILWIAAGIVALMGSLSVAELGIRVPKSGGMYQHYKASFGKWLGFAASFTLLLLARPSSQAIMALTFAKYVTALYFRDGCGDAPWYITKMFAISLLVFLGAMNCYSVKIVARMHIFTSAGKFCALIMIIVGGIYNIVTGNTGSLGTGFEGSNLDPSTIAIGMYSCMFAYSGWQSVIQVVEEVKTPGRNIPIISLVVIVVVSILYTLVNISYFSVMTVDELLKSPAVGVTWAERVIPGFTWVLPLCVALSVFGSLNGGLMAGSRTHFVMARDGIWPDIFSMIHVNRYTPAPCMMLTVTLGIVYVITSDVSGLIRFMSFIVWFFVALQMVALFILRHTMKDVHTTYRVPTLFPVVTLLVSTGLVVIPIINSPRIEFLYGALLTASGLVVYAFIALCKRKQSRFSAFDKLTCFLQMWLQVSPQSNKSE